MNYFASMIRETPGTRKAKASRKRRKRPIRFPGIVAAAQALGVSRVHLYLVLSGRRKSARLLERYEEWKDQTQPQGDPES